MIEEKIETIEETEEMRNRQKDMIQKHTAKIPTTKGLPQAARQTIEQYLKLADWASLLANKDPQENDQSWVSSTEILA